MEHLKSIGQFLFSTGAVFFLSNFLWSMTKAKLDKIDDLEKRVQKVENFKEFEEKYLKNK